MYFVAAHDGHIFAVSATSGTIVYTNEHACQGRYDWNEFARILGIDINNMEAINV